MPGLSNEERTTFWKFFHNLIPTKSRLHRITRTTPDPICTHCDTGAVDHAWNHTFLTCPTTKPIMDWLVEILKLVPIPEVNIEMALWIQFPPLIPEHDLLSAVWLVGETLTYSWARRKNREAVSIHSLRAILQEKAHFLSQSSRHSEAGIQLCNILGEHPHMALQ